MHQHPKEIRSFSGVDVSSDGKSVEGYCIVYNEWSQAMPLPGGKPGTFREIIRPGAATDALAAPDIPALYAHDETQYLGRTSNGTLTLSEDSKGVRYSVTLPETQVGNDVRHLVKRGDIRGASFHLIVPAGGSRWSTDGGKVTHDINKLLIGEITLTPFPAYPQTSADLRSLAELHSQAEFEQWLRLAKVRLAELD
jgi:HK97 family phage prohead protease